MVGVATTGERLRPSRTVPHCTWSASGGRWSLRPVTVVVLWAGLWAYGTGEALLIRARLGNTPWTVLSQGISERTGLSVGTITILISATVMLTWIPFRERPGFGTISNILLIGVAIDVMSPLVPHPDLLAGRVAQMVLGVAVCGFGCALYLTTGLGPGARDGLMTSLHRHFDRPIAWMRLGIEAVVLVGGIALGGHAGVGTALFAFGIGHAMSWWFTAFTTADRRVGRPVAVAGDPS
jgi:uncharacterized membrane protein YczE